MIARSVVSVCLAMTLMITAGGSSAVAGPYSDDLSRCILGATTAEDREGLIRWMFTAISRHPVVGGMSSISSSQMEDVSRDTALLFERLISEDCRTQSGQAVKYEGTAAIGASFQLLGQVAAKEIFEHEDVASTLADLEKHIDLNKIEKSLSVP